MLWLKFDHALLGKNNSNTNNKININTKVKHRLPKLVFVLINNIADN